MKRLEIMIKVNKIKNIIEAKIENGNHMKLLCDCGGNSYKVIEFDIDLNNVEINNTQEVKFTNSTSIICNDICNLIIPILPTEDKINLIMRDWK